MYSSNDAIRADVMELLGRGQAVLPPSHAIAGYKRSLNEFLCRRLHIPAQGWDAQSSFRKAVIQIFDHVRNHRLA